MADAAPIVLEPGDLVPQGEALRVRLAAEGLAPGTRIAIASSDPARFVIAREALARGRWVAVPINHHLTAPECKYILAHSASALVLVAPRESRRISAAAAELTAPPSIWPIPLEASANSAPPSDLLGATLIYTSGTTGEAKGCLRTEEQERARADEITNSYSIGPRDCLLVASPLAHSAPGIFLRAARRAGARSVLLPSFSATEVLAAIERHRATFFFMVPTQYERLLSLPPDERGRYDVSSVRCAIVAGAPVAPATKARITDWLGPVLWEFYGSSETGTVAVLSPADAQRAATSVGRPAPGVAIRLLDDAGAAVPTHTVGEIFVGSPAVMAGYTRPGATELLPRDELISVGDLGYLDDAGFLYLSGRRHDTIITGGVNVYPAEVERALAEHPAVHRSVVFGRSDPSWGERVEALITLRHGRPAPSFADLKSFLSDRLAGFKIPKRIAIVSDGQIPIGPSGKAVRRLAREVRGQPLAH